MPSALVVDTNILFSFFRENPVRFIISHSDLFGIKLFKKPPRLIPDDDVTVVLSTNVHTWMVEWTSRQGSFSSDTRPEAEAFTSENEAKLFKKTLEDAFKLIKHTSGTTVTIRKS